MKKLILLFVLLFSLHDLSAQCQDTVYLSVDSEVEFGDLQVDLRVGNFQNILGGQVELRFDPTVVQLRDFDFEESIDLNVAFNETENWVRFSFIDPGVTDGFTLEDNTSLFTAYFEIISAGDPNIILGDGIGLETEFALENGAACIVFDSPPIGLNGAHVFGEVIRDDNANCEADDDIGIKGWVVTIQSEDYTTTRITNSEGIYSALLPVGEYDITLTAPNESWSICQEMQSISVLSEDDEIETDFVAAGVSDCPHMVVTLSTPRLRRCFDSFYFVRWTNQGFGLAVDAYIEVQLDPYLDFVSTSAENSSYDESTGILRVDLGIAESLTEGGFNIKVYVDCESALGQTHCTDANIYPNLPCQTNNNWSGAELVVNGVCEGDSIAFKISNIGDGGMQQSTNFIVVEDQVMRESFEVQLGVQEEIEYKYEANGSTYRVIVDQPDNYHYGDMVSDAVEACGTSEDGTFSLGYVTMFSSFDDNPHLDIHCEENIGSYDPNDKQAWPKGYQETNLIEDYVVLDYKIRFQNTGTDTAFNIVVKDEISEHLDLSTIRFGSSSHSYTYDVEDNRTLVFKFENILLPDSTTNLIGSNGYLDYTIQQMPDNPDGTIIDNSADIYFDFNDPIVTNVVRREVGSDFIEVVLSNDDALSDIYSIYPNPVTHYMTIDIPSDYTRLRYELYNLDGRKIQAAPIDANDRIYINDLENGIYFVRLYSGDQDLGIQKLVCFK